MKGGRPRRKKSKAAERDNRISFKLHKESSTFGFVRPKRATNSSPEDNGAMKICI